MNAVEIRKLKNIYKKSIEELNLFLIKTDSKIRRCEHSKSDPRLRLLIDADFCKEVSVETFANFMVLTGVDQSLFFKSPEISVEFKKLFPNLPIPVTFAGFGCAGVLTPAEMLEFYLRFNSKPRVKARLVK
jgi:hypothetical protein